MLTYKSSGVDKEKGYQTVELIKKAVAGTFTEGVKSDLGSFGAFFKLAKYNNPILVSGTDGVGTKIKIAAQTKSYDTIGIDCFAMCANDILCHGAKPLFFLDYLATGKLEPKTAAKIIIGMANACKATGTALIGGETAEMPGVYQPGDFDIAGFCVGVVEEADLINGSKIQEGDIVLALASSGLHSNGFSLVRKIITNLNENFEGQKIYKELLKPTKLYVNEVHHLLDENIKINGIAHITGGGIIENLPRIIPNGLQAIINKKAVQIPTIIKYLQKKANINEAEMWGTFNMGIGLCLVLPAGIVGKTINLLTKVNCTAYPIGEIAKGKDKIDLRT